MSKDRATVNMSRTSQKLSIPMVTTVVSYDTIMQGRGLFTSPPPEFAKFLAQLKTGSLSSRPLIQAAHAGIAEKKQPLSVRSEIFSILNRLSPSDVKRCIEDIRRVKFETVDQLVELATTILDYAINAIEASMTRMYAEVAQGLLDLHVGTNPNNKFVIILLTKCQEEFGKDVATETVNRSKDADASEIEIYEQGRKQKFGLIRYIGELNACNVLNNDNTDACVKKLLNCATIGGGDLRTEAGIRLAMLMVKRYKKSRDNPKTSEIIYSISQIAKSRCKVNKKTCFAAMEFMDNIGA
jgi:hypothetical protein